MKTCKGFILLEILSAMMVFIVGILLLIKSLSLILKSNQYIQNHAYAALLADNIFARISSGETVEEKYEEKIMGKIFRYELEKTVLAEKLNKISIKIFWQQENKENCVCFVNTFIPNFVIKSN